MVSTTEMFERKFYKKSTGPHQKLARKHRRIKVAAIARVQLKNLVILLLLKRRIERMAPQTHKYLLSWIGPYIKNQETKMRKPVSSSDRLSLTGSCYWWFAKRHSYQLLYRSSVVSRTIGETCAAIWDVLMKKGYLTAPKTKEEWKEFPKHLRKGGIFRTH